MEGVDEQSGINSSVSMDLTDDWRSPVIFFCLCLGVCACRDGRGSLSQEIRTNKIIFFALSCIRHKK